MAGIVSHDSRDNVLASEKVTVIVTWSTEITVDRPAEKIYQGGDSDKEELRQTERDSSHVRNVAAVPQ